MPLNPILIQLMSRKKEVEKSHVHPHHHRSRSPFHTGLEILRESDMVEQEFEQVVGLLLLVANDVASDCVLCELECFLPGRYSLCWGGKKHLHCAFTNRAFSPVT